MTDDRWFSESISITQIGIYTLIAISIGAAGWWGTFLYRNGLCKKVVPSHLLDVDYSASWVEYRSSGDKGSVMIPVVHPEKFYLKWAGRRSKTGVDCVCSERVSEMIYVQYRNTLAEESR